MKMMMEFFKTNGSLQEQYIWGGMGTIEWMGDDKLHDFYTRWLLVTQSLSPMPPDELTPGKVPATNEWGGHVGSYR